jgi:hypothetical protein
VRCRSVRVKVGGGRAVELRLDECATTGAKAPTWLSIQAAAMRSGEGAGVGKQRFLRRHPRVDNGVVFRSGEVCSLCGVQPSTRMGEHAWPQWFLDRFSVDDGPFKTEMNGNPLLTRAGRPRCHTALPRILLPCCRTCNGKLDARFEKPGKELIRRMLDSSDIELTAAEVRVAGEWFVKTLLFLSHPHARSNEPVLTKNAWSPAPPEDVYRWTITGQQPPTSLSLWIGWSPETPHPNRVTMALPVVHADGQEHVFQVAQRGIQGTSLLSATLLYHPGWPVEHPHERTREVVRLWPPRDPGSPVSIRRQEPTSDVRWLNSGMELGFSPGAYGNVELPNLDGIGFGQFDGVMWGRQRQRG